MAILGGPLQQEWVVHISENQWSTWAILCNVLRGIKFIDGKVEKNRVDDEVNESSKNSELKDAA